MLVQRVAAGSACVSMAWEGPQALQSSEAGLTVPQEANHENV